MTYRNIIQRGTETTGLAKMINRGFLDIQHRDIIGFLRMLAVFFFPVYK